MMMQWNRKADILHCMNIDKNSSEWRQIKEWAEKRLEDMREQNDGDIGKTKTSKLRGKIEFAQELLSLGDEVKSIHVASEPGYVD